MTKETMTVHEALSTLKTLDNRISSKITASTFVSSAKSSATKIDGMNRDEYEKMIKSNFDSVMGLIERRGAIRKALAASNAETVINVAGKEYRMSEAIELKQHGMGIKSELAHVLESNLLRHENLVRINNEEKIPKNVETYLSSMFGGKDKANSADVDAARESFIRANTMDVINPLNLRKKIEELQNEIDAFNSKIDSAISISNALTKIEIEY